jgi:hypothetical protein
MVCVNACAISFQPGCAPEVFITPASYPMVRISTIPDEPD